LVNPVAFCSDSTCPTFSCIVPYPPYDLYSCFSTIVPFMELNKSSEIGPNPNGSSILSWFLGIKHTLGSKDNWPLKVEQ
jgi:hypothetical protein